MISVENLKVEFGVKPLFSGANFVVNDRDRIALVGKNGAGKSTLLKILCGQQQPTGGVVNIPTDTTVGYLPQVMQLADSTTVTEETRKAFADSTRLKAKIDRMERELAERTDYESDEYMALVERFTQEHERYLMLGGENYEAEIERTLLGLGFLRTDFERPTSEFSGGWRMRIELAKILLRRPDVLLLDEPTNHLDIESIQWLEQFLATSGSAVILVSHDRAFINNVTNRTLEISCGQIVDYRVKYSEYVVLRKERREQQLRAYENQQKEIADMQAFINRFRYQATKAVQVQQKIKQLEKIVPIEIDEVDHSKLRLKFPPCLRSGDYPVIAEDVKKEYPAPHQLPPEGGGYDITHEEKKINRYRTAHPDLYMLLKDFSLQNSHDITDAERVLWEQLRGKQLGVKFRRQHIIGDYIADFICLSHRLVVEVDGEYHTYDEQKRIDQIRTDFLNKVGFNVLRFTNRQVLFEIDNVLNQIIHSLKASPYGGEVGEGLHLVFSNVNFTLKRGEKVAFVGKNGEGKTTLVKCIMGEIPFEGNLKIGHNVQIGYFAQNQAQLLDESLTVFETIDRVARGEIRLRINDILGAFMFGGEESDKKVKVLSGGERSRLAMIRLLLEPVNLLILDEPTNHLDMQSKDVLKEAIRAFDGTAIIVSHDREFLDGLVTKVYEFGCGRVREHLGGIYDWLRAPHLLPPEGGGSKDTMTIDERLAMSKASPTGGGLVGASKSSSTTQQPAPTTLKASYADQKEQQRKFKKAEKAVKACDEKIAQMEAQLKEMDAILMQPEHATDMKLINEYAEIMRNLEAENDRWMTLSEELEALNS